MTRRTDEEASANLPTPRRALAVGAHPDDVEFGCGGTLAKWARAGCAIYHAVCTDGSKGSWDADTDVEALVELRKSEQRAAARQLGGTEDVIFLAWPDGALRSGLAEQRELARVIRAVAPDVVLGHDPWKRYRLHPDHRNAGFLVTDAVVAARDPLFFPELDEAPHRPSHVLLWEADAPDHVEDIAPTIEVKVSALLAHRSQLRSTMDIPEEAGPDDPAFARFRQRLLDQASAAGALAGLELGEAFKRIEA